MWGILGWNSMHVGYQSYSQNQTFFEEFDTTQFVNQKSNHFEKLTVLMNLKKYHHLQLIHFLITKCKFLSEAKNRKF